jgi:hypothetical protein
MFYALYVVCMRSTESVPRRSMRGGFVFRNRGPSLKVHRGQCIRRDDECGRLRDRLAPSLNQRTAVECSGQMQWSNAVVKCGRNLAGSDTWTHP